MRGCETAGDMLPLRTARRRGKTLLRDEGKRPGQVRDLAGVLPCEVFSRLSRATRRSHGSLPQHVSHCPVRRAERVSQARLPGAAGRVLRGAPVSAVTRAKRGKTGSQRDGRAAHGAARVAEAMWRARFSTASNGAPAQNAPCGTLAVRSESSYLRTEVGIAVPVFSTRVVYRFTGRPDHSSLRPPGQKTWTFNGVAAVAPRPTSTRESLAEP